MYSKYGEIFLSIVEKRDRVAIKNKSLFINQISMYNK